MSAIRAKVGSYGCPYYLQVLRYYLQVLRSLLANSRRAVVRRIGEHHRIVDLPIRHAPIGLEKHSLARGRDQLETMAPIEPGLPPRGIPSADQHASLAQLAQMPEQPVANAAPLATRQDVSVPNEIDVTHRLHTHHAHEYAIVFIAPDGDACRDLAV